MHVRVARTPEVPKVSLPPSPGSPALSVTFRHGFRIQCFTAQVENIHIRIMQAGGCSAMYLAYRARNVHYACLTNHARLFSSSTTSCGGRLHAKKQSPDVPLGYARYIRSKFDMNCCAINCCQTCRCTACTLRVVILKWAKGFNLF